jgi:hypothetical protein
MVGGRARASARSGRFHPAIRTRLDRIGAVRSHASKLSPNVGDTTTISARTSTWHLPTPNHYIY